MEISLLAAGCKSNPESYAALCGVQFAQTNLHAFFENETMCKKSKCAIENKVDKIVERGHDASLKSKSRRKQARFQSFSGGRMFHHLENLPKNKLRRNDLGTPQCGGAQNGLMLRPTSKDTVYMHMSSQASVSFASDTSKSTVYTQAKSAIKQSRQNNLLNNTTSSVYLKWQTARFQGT